MCLGEEMEKSEDLMKVFRKYISPELPQILKQNTNSKQKVGAPTGVTQKGNKVEIH